VDLCVPFEPQTGDDDDVVNVTATEVCCCIQALAQHRVLHVIQVVEDRSL